PHPAVGAALRAARPDPRKIAARPYETPKGGPLAALFHSDQPGAAPLSFPLSHSSGPKYPRGSAPLLPPLNIKPSAEAVAPTRPARPKPPQPPPEWRGYWRHRPRAR